jgi:cell division septal protein FtsQ
MQDSISRLPWVASAAVSREFPNSLAVRIKPRVPKAHLRALGQDWEVDKSGVLIRRLRPGKSLPLIACAAASELKPGQRVDTVGLAGALKVVSECRPRGGVRIAKVEVDQSGELCLNMSDNVAIRLGQEEALPTKIDYIQRIYDDKPGIGSEVSSIDLRWPESPSCVLRNASVYTPENTQLSAPNRTVPTPRDPAKD